MAKQIESTKKIREYEAEMKAELEELKKHRSPSTEEDELAIEVISVQPNKELEVLNSKEAITELGVSIKAQEHEIKSEKPKSKSKNQITK